MRLAPLLSLLAALGALDARADSPASAHLAAAEDDPKLDRAGRVRQDPHTTVIKVAYRRLELPNLDRSRMGFNAVELDMYPLSIRWVRVGMDAELGFGSGVSEGKPNSAWFLLTGMNVGFQYPWRVTPFLDARFVAGLIGGDVAGQAAISWLYMGGLETGAEVFVVDRLHVTFSVGWMRATYRGVDLPYMRAHPTEELRFLDFTGDTYTVKVGIGL